MRPRDRKRKFKHPNNSQNEAPSVSFGQDDYSHQQANQEGNVDLRSVLNKRRYDKYFLTGLLLREGVKKVAFSILLKGEWV